MLNISITTTVNKAIMRLSVQAPKKFAAVAAQTINDTEDFGERLAMRLIPEKYEISAGGLRSSPEFKWVKKRVSPAQMRIPKAWGGTGKKLQGDLTLYSRRLPLIKFKVSPMYVPVQKGIPIAAREVVSFSTVRGSTRSGKPNRFMARMKSGHLGVFMRKPGATPRGSGSTKTWLPIAESMMISPSEMLASKRIRPIFEQRLSRYFERQLRKNLAGGIP